jgi:hypothetical protein
MAKAVDEDSVLFIRNLSDTLREMLSPFPDASEVSRSRGCAVAATPIATEPRRATRFVQARLPDRIHPVDAAVAVRAGKLQPLCPAGLPAIAFSSSRSPSARDGHRFESPQLHQEVATNHPGFPAPAGERRRSSLRRQPRQADAERGDALQVSAHTYPFWLASARGARES